MKPTGAAWRILRRQGMPANEIRAVLTADDPLVVRRHLELHLERMEETLAVERRILVTLGEMLAGDVATRTVRSTTSGSCWGPASVA